MTGLDELGDHVARREDALLDRSHPDEGVRRAIAERTASRAERKTAPRFRVWPAHILLVAALVATAFAVWIHGRSNEAPLTFVVGDPPRAGVLREWVSAPAARELPIGFSDGSRVQLLPGARGRVVRTSPSGAELVVEAGSARVEVTPRRGADYRLRSGPFDVEVTGTRFVAAWNPEHDEFELELYEGHVRVRGCGLGDGVSVAAGQRMEASCSPATFSVRPRGEPATRAKSETAHRTASVSTSIAQKSAPVVSTAPSPNPASPRENARMASKPEATNAASWTELARQGRFRRAYEVAKSAGFEAECAVSGPAELLMLGDTARLSGHGGHAIHAYTLLRRRFPASEAASQAAFHLGRLASRAEDDAPNAARWFEVYLQEQPGGPLAEAALGRMLEIEVRRKNTARARQLAKTYLERYPLGAHADAAREILAARAGD
jgi:transmembrane sensor